MPKKYQWMLIDSNGEDIRQTILLHELIADEIAEIFEEMNWYTQSTIHDLGVYELHKRLIEQVITPLQDILSHTEKKLAQELQ